MRKQYGTFFARLTQWIQIPQGTDGSKQGFSLSRMEDFSSHYFILTWWLS
jgi:hypothetical protein